jgi:hypothetical protein
VSEGVAEAIGRFRNARQPSSGESVERLEATEALTEHLANEQARHLLLASLQDTNEYDLARIAICRALQVFEAPSQAVAGQCAAALLAVLAPDDDTLVRQWSAQALRTYTQVPGVSAGLLEALGTPDEDVDVRHNALGSLWNAALEPADTACLRDLADDSELGISVQRMLAERESAPHPGQPQNKGMNLSKDER